jgi:EmrB/QacA subfamily drug resistance transporter
MKSNSSQRWVLGLTAVASLMITMDALVVTTVLGTIRRELGTSIAELEWTVNAYTLTFAVLLMTAAAVGDRFGRRRMLIAGLGLFVTASAGCALSPDAGWLIAARVVQGAGAALVMPPALALLSAAFPPERRGWALGVFSGVTGLGVGLGPVLGGVIAQEVSWQWIFWLNVPIGLIAIPLVRARIEEGVGPRTKLDIRGVVLVTGAALGTVWGLVRGNAAGWGSVEVVASLAAGALLAAVFVCWELRASEPMLPIRLFRSRAFSSGNTATFFVFGAMYGTVFFMAQFQQTTLGQGALDAGLRLVPLTGTLFLIAPWAGALVDRVGERPLMLGGALVTAAGGLWIALIAQPGLAYAAMVAPMVIIGAGISVAMPAMQKSIIGAVAPSEIGKASGIFSTMRYLGGAFGIATSVAVFAAAGSYASPQAFSDGFAPAVAVCSGLALTGAIAALATPARRAETDASPSRVEPTRPRRSSSTAFPPDPETVQASALHEPDEARCGDPVRPSRPSGGRHRAGLPSAQ